jgi:hypothetical protein
MTKRILILAVLFMASTTILKAQGDFGIKAGLSYNSNGDLSEFTTEVDNIYKNDGKGKSGFNVGLYGKIDLGTIFIRPELVYTKTTSEYELNSQMLDYKVSKLDAPVLVGINLIGPLSVFAGPAFQYIIDNDLDNSEVLNDIENDFTMGLNIGASLEFGRIGIDVRYERGLSSNEADWTNAGETFSLDSRPEQLIFSLSYSLSKKNVKY